MKMMKGIIPCNQHKIQQHDRSYASAEPFTLTTTMTQEQQEPLLPLDIIFHGIAPFVNRETWNALSIMNKEAFRLCHCDQIIHPRWPTTMPFVLKSCHDDVHSISFSSDSQTLVCAQMNGRVHVLDIRRGCQKHLGLHMSNDKHKKKKKRKYFIIRNNNRNNNNNNGANSVATIGQVAVRPKSQNKTTTTTTTTTRTTTVSVGYYRKHANLNEWHYKNPRQIITNVISPPSLNKENDNINDDNDDIIMDSSSPTGILAWSPNGQILAQVYFDDTIRLCQVVQTNQEDSTCCMQWIQTIPRVESESTIRERPEKIAFSPKTGTLFAATVGGELYIWHHEPRNNNDDKISSFSSPPCRAPSGDHNFVWFSFAPCEKYIATVNVVGVVHIWSIQCNNNKNNKYNYSLTIVGKIGRSFQGGHYLYPYQPSMEYLCAEFDPNDSTKIVMCGFHNEIHVWKLLQLNSDLSKFSCKKIGFSQLPRHEIVPLLAFTPNGETLVSFHDGCTYQCLRFWDYPIFNNNNDNPQIIQSSSSSTNNNCQGKKSSYCAIKNTWRDWVRFSIFVYRFRNFVNN